ncbi:hypothetical protein BDY19DRAFT_722199 [Irpex rosettiformis]|uniref:Uncharacterized protein n=1 Tax=Irpex rosettiformis TaxID=378272 RepID=A0ACB8U8P3_9APHY|nr:hypothetical protein BDY19DRAFT_722199 [Irpex rosettiformis]
MSPSHRLSSPHQDDDDDGDDNISLLSLPDDDSDSDGEASLSHSITKDDILPMSAKDMAALQDAVVTMQISRELFKSWDKVLRENGKSSAVSRSVVEELHDTVKKLLSQSSKALGAAKKMLDAHCRYSRALYESLKSSSTTGHLEITRDMEREVEKIQANARLYSDTVALMKDTLQSLTEQLGEAVKRAKKKDSWKKILLKWLRRFLRVLASLFAVGSALSVFAGPLIGAGLGAGSVLGKALAAIIPKGV